MSMGWGHCTCRWPHLLKRYHLSNGGCQLRIDSWSSSDLSEHGQHGLYLRCHRCHCLCFGCHLWWRQLLLELLEMPVLEICELIVLLCKGQLQRAHLELRSGNCV